MDPEQLRAAAPASFVWPDYGGGSVANIPPTVGALLGVDAGWGGVPLRDVVRPDPPWDRVVLLLLDGMGWTRFRRALTHDPHGIAPFWRRARTRRITSVVPSTTSVATTVMAGDGSSPLALGMLGYTVRLAEHGLLANLLSFKAEGDSSAEPGSLERWGVNPVEFLPTPSIFEVLADAGLPSVAILPKAIAGSSLARMQQRGAEVLRAFDFVDALHQLQAWLSRDRAGYAYLYHPPLDTLSHRDGPDTDLWDATLASITDDLRRFCRGLTARERERSLLLVTADHGHVTTPPLRRRSLADVPGLVERSALRAGGEWRIRYLYLRPDDRGGQPSSAAIDELVAAARATFGDDAWVLPMRDAIASGLFGPPASAHPEAARRLGDVLVLARDAVGLRNPGDHEAMLGMHGSLEPEEMWVPLLSFDLADLDDA